MRLSKKLGDRADGYRVTNVEPFFLIMPYIMKDRTDSHVYYSDELDITGLERFVWEHQGDIPGLRMYHVMIAAMVRVYSQRPYLNRFVADRRLYARKEISVSLAIRRGNSAHDDGTVVKPDFEPEATLGDVVRAFNELVEANRTDVTENATDRFAKRIGRLPHGLLKLTVNFLMLLDRKNCLPAALRRISPFHAGLFIADMGAAGIEPFYHHLYGFGTTSVFAVIGKKRTERLIGRDGKPVKRRYMGIRLVADERICSGQYYAESVGLFAELLQNPELLLAPPEQVVVDKGIRKLYERKMICESGEEKTVKQFEQDEKYKVY